MRSICLQSGLASSNPFIQMMQMAAGLHRRNEILQASSIIDGRYGVFSGWLRLSGMQRQQMHRYPAIRQLAAFKQRPCLTLAGPAALPVPDITFSMSMTLCLIVETPLSPLSPPLNPPPLLQLAPASFVMAYSSGPHLSNWLVSVCSVSLHCSRQILQNSNVMIARMICFGHIMQSVCRGI